MENTPRWEPASANDMPEQIGREEIFTDDNLVRSMETLFP